VCRAAGGILPAAGHSAPAQGMTAVPGSCFAHRSLPPAAGAAVFAGHMLRPFAGLRQLLHQAPTALLPVFVKQRCAAAPAEPAPYIAARAQEGSGVFPAGPVLCFCPRPPSGDMMPHSRNPPFAMCPASLRVWYLFRQAYPSLAPGFAKWTHYTTLEARCV